MFQNLPTRDNELMVMRNSFSLNPYLSLKVIKAYICNASAYKRRELMTKVVMKS
jgi:hypothetical protein